MALKAPVLNTEFRKTQFSHSPINFHQMRPNDLYMIF